MKTCALLVALALLSPARALAFSPDLELDAGEASDEDRGATSDDGGIGTATAAPFDPESMGPDEDDDPGTFEPESDRPRIAIDPREVTKKAGPARRKELANAAYRFCHDPSFGKAGTDGTDFCLIFDESSDEVCPEARKHCKDWKPGRDPCEDPGSAACKAFLSRHHGGGRSRLSRSLSAPFSLSLPPAVSWTLIGIAVALALFWFVRALKKAGWESKDDEQLSTAAITEAERNLQALPEARSVALLRMAERALERGEDADAAILLHLAVLRHLDDEGLARYHPSKTNGDYLRAIRAHKPVASLFRGVARETERLRFGDGTTDASVLRGLVAEATRVFTDRPKEPQELGAAPLVLLAMLAATQSGCPRSETADPAYHSRGPAGMAALPQILREAGLSVEISRGRLSALPDDVGVVVIRTSAVGDRGFPESFRLDGVLDKNVSVVVIDDLWHPAFFMPVTATATPPRRAVDVDVEPPSGDVFCTWRLEELGAIPATGPEAIRLPEGRRLTANLGQTRTASVSTKPLRLASVLGYTGAPRLSDGRVAAVAFAADRIEHDTSLAGCLYMFADRDVFTNASLSREPNARFAVGFFAALAKDGRRIVLLDRFDRWSTSQGEGDEQDPEQKAANPTKPLRASNLLPFIAQAGLLLIVFFIAVGAAFGPLRDPAVREHKAFVEHVEAIGRQYAATGLMGLTHSARSLARLVVMRSRDLVRNGPGGWAAVAVHLAEKLDLEEKDVKAAIRLGLDGQSDLGAPGPDDPSPSSERMLRTLSRLLGRREVPKAKRRSSTREDPFAAKKP